MKKYGKDIILLTFFLCVALICLSCHFFKNGFHSEEDSRTANIYLNGELIRCVDLNEDISFRIDSPGGYNVITVKDNAIAVTDSDCTGRTCVNTGYIHNNTSFIACIPHGLFIRIDSDQAGGDLDAIAY